MKKTRITSNLAVQNCVSIVRDVLWIIYLCLLFKGKIGVSKGLQRNRQRLGKEGVWEQEQSIMHGCCSLRWMVLRPHRNGEQARSCLVCHNHGMLNLHRQCSINLRVWGFIGYSFSGWNHTLSHFQVSKVRSEFASAFPLLCVGVISIQCPLLPNWHHYEKRHVHEIVHDVVYTEQCKGTANINNDSMCIIYSCEVFALLQSWVRASRCTCFIWS